MHEKIKEVFIFSIHDLKNDFSCKIIVIICIYGKSVFYYYYILYEKSVQFCISHLLVCVRERERKRELKQKMSYRSYSVYMKVCQMNQRLFCMRRDIFKKISYFYEKKKKKNFVKSIVKLLKYCEVKLCPFNKKKNSFKTLKKENLN